MELMVATALFIGMIACWLRLPGSSAGGTAAAQAAERSAETSAGHGARQPA